MPAELRAEWLADLVFLELVERLLEFRVEGAGRCPAEVAAAARRARVLRGDARQRLEVLPGENAVAQRGEALPRGRIVLHLVRPHQDVARVDLLDHDRPAVSAARAVEPYEVESGRRTDRLGDLAGLHADH